MININETHDQNLKSWVESANDPNTDFPIQNLPFCTFKHTSTEFGSSLGIRIGNEVIDLSQLLKTENFSDIFSSSEIMYSRLVSPGFGEDSFNNIATFSNDVRMEFRNRLVKLLSEDCPPEKQEKLKDCLLSVTESSFKSSL